MNIPEPDESWARVELWRWQHGGECGHLPQNDDMRPVDVPTALDRMAAATERGQTSPMNCAIVMRYASKLLRPNAPAHAGAVATSVEPDVGQPKGETP